MGPERRPGRDPAGRSANSSTRVCSRAHAEGAFDALLSVPAGARAPVLGSMAGPVANGGSRVAAASSVGPPARAGGSSRERAPAAAATFHHGRHRHPGDLNADRTLEVRWGLLLTFLVPGTAAPAGRDATALRPRDPTPGAPCWVWPSRPRVQGAGQMRQGRSWRRSRPRYRSRPPATLGWDTTASRASGRRLPSTRTTEDMVVDRVLALAATQPFLTAARRDRSRVAGPGLPGWSAWQSPCGGANCTTRDVAGADHASGHGRSRPPARAPGAPVVRRRRPDSGGPSYSWGPDSLSRYW